MGLRIRRDTAANWTTNDPTLGEGEFGYETDTGTLKIGDGTTAWTSLADFGGGGGGAWGGITGTLSAQTDLQTALDAKVDDSAISAFGMTLVDDADASAARATLGLGTLATQSGTFSGTSSGTNTGDQTITLTGDATGSGTGSFAVTIAADAVTNAKLANMAANTVKVRADSASGDASDLALAASQLLGRGSTGDIAAIVLGQLLSMSGTTLRALPGFHYAVPLASGAYVNNATVVAALTTYAGAANRCDMYPFIPSHDLAISEIAVEITTGVGSAQGRAGIYSDDGSGKPGALFAGGATAHDFSTTGWKTEAISVTLLAGNRYWLGIQHSSTATLRAIGTQSALVISHNTGAGAAPNTAYRATGATFASGFPNPAATSTALNPAVCMFRLLIA